MREPMQMLRDAAEDFAQFMLALSPAQRVGKMWGPREVLAHLLFWLTEVARQLEAIADGQPPQPRQSPIYQLNDQAVVMVEGARVADMVTQLRLILDRIEDLLLQVPDTISLQKTAASPAYPLLVALEFEAGHIRHHLHELEAQQHRDADAESRAIYKMADKTHGLYRSKFQLAGRVLDVPESLRVFHVKLLSMTLELDNLLKGNTRHPEIVDMSGFLVSNEGNYTYEMLIAEALSMTWIMADVVAMTDPQSVVLPMPKVYPMDEPEYRLIDDLGRWMLTVWGAEYRRLQQLLEDDR